MVERYGYTAEEHYVTTEDGYNLVIHRISGSPLSKGQQRRKVVFLQHGFVLSSDCWVMFGAGKDLGEWPLIHNALIIIKYINRIHNYFVI